MKIKTFKNRAQLALERLEKLIQQMPHHGDSSEESQKICLQQKLNELESCINGTEQRDLNKPIEMDMIEFNGTEYPSRTFLVRIDGVKQDITIASSELSDELAMVMQGTDKDMAEEAENIDDGIYFYLDAYLLELEASEICEKHLDVLVKLIKK